MRITTSRNSRQIRNDNYTREPTGFINPLGIVSTYNSVDRTITISGDLRCLYNGYPIIDFATTSGTWTSDPHTDTPTASLFLKFGSNGFEWSTTPWKFYEVQIAFLFYSASTGILFALREVHGTMNHESHRTDHLSRGTIRLSGGDFNNYILQDSANRTPNISSCSLLDEDLDSVLDAFDYASENYTILNMTSTSTINFTTDQSQITLLSGSFPAYNSWNGSEFVQTELVANSSMSVWVMAAPTTNDDQSKKYRYMFIQGQSSSPATSAELTKSPLDLNLGNLSNVLPEFTFIAQVIIRRVSAGGGVWYIDHVTSLRGSRALYVGQSGSFLTGVTAEQVTFDNTVTNALSAEDLQAAVDELSLLLETTEKTDDYTLELEDIGKVVLMNKVGAGTLTIPDNTTVAFPIGTVINAYNVSTDDVTIVGAAGVVVRNNGAFGQYKEASLRKRATDEWVAVGDIV